MTSGATVVGDEFLPARNALRVGPWEMNVGLEFIVFLTHQKARQKGDLLLVVPVTRHARLRIVSLWGLQPPAKPVGIHLAADAGQLWREVPANQISGRVLDGM